MGIWQCIPIYAAWSSNLYDTQYAVHTSSNWSPYSNPAWWAMLPPVTLETKIPPFSPPTMEMPSGSAPLCTMTLRGSSKYGLAGRRNVYKWKTSQKSSYRIAHWRKLRGWGDGLTNLVTALESDLLPRLLLQLYKTNTGPNCQHYQKKGKIV